jgi:vacuolar-type H+-ATPase subunit E/Vma4
MADALHDMLALVSTHAAAQRTAILERAQQEAVQIVTAAHREARTRMHDMVAEIREAMTRELRQAQAALDTARRQQRAHCDAALIEGAWRELPEVLAALWRDPAARQAWVEKLMIEAHQALPRGRWEIQHPRDWPVAEQQPLARALQSDLSVSVEFVSDPGIRAGLRLCAQGACLDGTIDGLLLDQRAVEGRLLALLGEDGP